MLEFENLAAGVLFTREKMIIRSPPPVSGHRRAPVRSAAVWRTVRSLRGTEHLKGFILVLASFQPPHKTGGWRAAVLKVKLEAVGNNHNVPPTDSMV